jgi:hypothetical protein
LALSHEADRIVSAMLAMGKSVVEVRSRGTVLVGDAGGVTIWLCTKSTRSRARAAPAMGLELPLPPDRGNVYNARQTGCRSGEEMAMIITKVLAAEGFCYFTH